MEDLKSIIAENITALRKGSSMTQIELAEKLNYSDKAISKWERGESVPDITVLKTIADMFGVTVDYLLVREHISEDQELSEEEILKHEREEKKQEKKYTERTNCDDCFFCICSCSTYHDRGVYEG